MSEVHSPADTLSIAILAGGQSRRMGQDKALLRVGERRLIEIVAERARPLGSELFVVATDGQRYARLGFRVVPDLLPGSGPLGGIYTALNAARQERCLVVGCDMPFLNQALLGYMRSLPFDYEALVPVICGEPGALWTDKTYETLHAIYARAALPALERRIRTGRLKIVDALSDLRLREIDEATVRRFDPQLRSFFNANSPDDVACMERMMGRKEDGH